jgi:hypothetical protein
LSVVGQQRKGSLPADELKETKIVLMADFYESFLQFAIRCERDGEREVNERRERREEAGEREWFFFFLYLIILRYSRTLYIWFYCSIL